MSRKVVVLLSLLVLATGVAAGGSKVVRTQEILDRQQLVLVALGKAPADRIIQDVNMLEVHTLQWLDHQDIVIKGERIAWVGPTGGWTGQAATVDNASGYRAVPGFVESHKHIESTHLTPDREAMLVLPQGNTSTVEDSHEFGNVTSEHNIEYWTLPEKMGSPLKIFPNIGSAIPPTPFEFTGGYYGYREVIQDMKVPRVMGLGEVMDWPSVWNPAMPGYERMWDVIQATLSSRGVVEGHGTNLASPSEASAFAAAGLSTDHQLAAADAWAKLSRGVLLELKPAPAQTIIPNLLSHGLTDWHMVALTTDDRSVLDTTTLGGMNYDIRETIKAGMPVDAAYAAASLYPAQHADLERNIGSISPGRYADVVLLRGDPKDVDIFRVYANGRPVAENGQLLPSANIPTINWNDYEWAVNTIKINRHLGASDFAILAPSGHVTVTANILTPRYYGEEPLSAVLPVVDGQVRADPAQSIVKFAIVDRYHRTVSVARMFWKNVGPSDPESAVASSVAHDHHNIWVLGSSDYAMAQAVNRLIEQQGGWALIENRRLVGSLTYEVGGLMTAQLPSVAAANEAAFFAELQKYNWYGAGWSGIKSMIFATLTCQPWKWVLVAPFQGCSSGFVNVTTGECRPVIRP